MVILVRHALRPIGRIPLKLRRLAFEIDDQIPWTIGGAETPDVHGIAVPIGALIDPDLFTGLGMNPRLGREMPEPDGQPGAPPVFFISDRLWRTRFNRDPSVLGTSFPLNGTQRTLIGIMPPRFLMLNADIWIPAAFTPGMTVAAIGDSGSDPLFVVVWARLKEGITLQQAEADIDVIMHREARLRPADFPREFRASVPTVAERWTRGLRRIVFVLLAAVLMLLLIACSNVAHLLLARSSAREKEFAIRATVGAMRRDLVRLVMIESLLLAGAGAVLGCFLAYAGIQWVKAANPPGVPAEIEFKLNFGALLGTVVITLLTALLCGLVPALRAARGNLQSRLTGSEKGVATGSGNAKLRAVLVAGQSGLAIAMLVSAGLMIRTFVALTHVDLGFSPRNLLIARLVFPRTQYATSEAKQAFFRRLLPRIAGLPGVISVGLSDSEPVKAPDRSEVSLAGEGHEETWTAGVDYVNEDYFGTLDLPAASGRMLAAADLDSARKVAVVNRQLEHEFLGDRDPVGKTIRVKELDDGPFQIIGMVENVRNDGLENDPRPEIFVPHTITVLADDIVEIRTAVAPESMVEPIRQIVSGIDPEVALTDAASLENTLHRDFLGAREFGLTLLSVFAAIGLMLSSVGAFSVVSYAVSLQTHDIGIRMALGATE
jgi:predicted permease